MTEYGQPQFGLDNLDQLVFQYKKLIKDLMIYKDFLSDINHFQSFLMKQEEVKFIVFMFLLDFFKIIALFSCNVYLAVEQIFRGNIRKKNNCHMGND